MSFWTGLVLGIVICYLFSFLNSKFAISFVKMRIRFYKVSIRVADDDVKSANKEILRTRKKSREFESVLKEALEK